MMINLIFVKIHGIPWLVITFYFINTKTKIEISSLIGWVTIVDWDTVSYLKVAFANIVLHLLQQVELEGVS